MEKQPLISVIVPVYNVEEYLPRCLDSIINQTYTNLEILLIDDGATDNSGKICDEYAQKDKRIRVFHKPNGGQASARNLALDNATGEYVAFVDSDDYIEEEMFDKCIPSLVQAKADILIYGYYMDYPTRSIPSHVLEEEKIIQGGENLLREYLSTDIISGLLWNKIYRRALWENIRMPLYRASEDNATCYKVMDKAQTTLVFPKRYYHYIQRSTSTEHDIKIENHFVCIAVAEERYKYISEKYPSLENLINQNRWNIYTAMYKRLFFVNKQKQFKDELEKWLKFFRENEAPNEYYQKEKDKILKHPYAYGNWLGFVYRLKKFIKKLLKSD